MNISKLVWGNRVIDFIDKICPYSRKVTWKNPDHLPLSTQEKQMFKDYLDKRLFYILDEEDGLFWAPAKNGCYSVKEGYKLLQRMPTQKNPSRAYKFCWNHVVLPKAGCFAWLALKHIILTSDRLTKLIFILHLNVSCVMKNMNQWITYFSPSCSHMIVGFLFSENFIIILLFKITFGRVFNLGCFFFQKLYLQEFGYVLQLWLFGLFGGTGTRGYSEMSLQRKK